MLVYKSPDTDFSPCDVLLQASGTVTIFGRAILITQIRSHAHPSAIAAHVPITSGTSFLSASV